MIRWMSSSLPRKLSVIILISTMVPLASLGYFTYKISSEITDDKLRQSAQDTLHLMAGRLEFVMDDVDTMAIFLLGQDNVQDYLNSPEDNPQLRQQILSLMMNLAVSKKHISNIMIVPKKFEDRLSTSNIYDTNFSDFTRLDYVFEQLWIPPYSVTDFSGERKVMSIVHPVKNIHNFETTGWLLISLDLDEVSRFWTEASLGEGTGKVALLNENGIIVSTSEAEWMSRSISLVFPGIFMNTIGGYFGEAVINKDRHDVNVFYYNLPFSDWTLVGTIPRDLNLSQNTFILQLTAGAVLISSIINAFIILFVIYKITNPLTVLTRLLTRINPEQPLPLYQTLSNDEIGRLGQSYNMLGTHIKKLKDQLILEETRKKEADIRALQAQINPHFLYNTLSSIHWMALMSHEQQIADMVGALSDFLQFSLNKGREYCTIQQEFSHVKNYAEIQSIRFPDKFDLSLFVDPELKEKYILKLLLQPLLENSLIHGLMHKDKKGTISIYVRKEDHTMHFSIIDDGVGMTPERLQQVQHNMEQFDLPSTAKDSYGLSNVNERLQLHYGPESQLHIESRLDEGTRISFSIPIMEVPYEDPDR